MKSAVDERLRDEAARFAFRFACEDCSHATGPPAASICSSESAPRCSLGYPAAPLREALGEHAVEFCKEFELGPA